RAADVMVVTPLRDGMNLVAKEYVACRDGDTGALVLSEPRAGVTSAVPELPTFRNEGDAAALIERFLAEPAERLRVQRACSARLAGATYLQRLRTVMNVALPPESVQAAPIALPAAVMPPAAMPPAARRPSAPPKRMRASSRPRSRPARIPLRRPTTLPDSTRTGTIWEASCERAATASG
ncbi:MAG: trehalose-6-phosphate synthase, partial [Gammaproteobacteria bacterium]